MGESGVGVTSQFVPEAHSGLGPFLAAPQHFVPTRPSSLSHSLPGLSDPYFSMAQNSLFKMKLCLTVINVYFLLCICGETAGLCVI